MTQQSTAPTNPAHAGIVRVGAHQTDQLGTPYRPLGWRSADGLHLYGRDYGDATSARPPLLCLAGLTRNSRDFEPVAAHLVPLGFRIITIDSRGRGRSDWDPNPANYTPMTELLDFLGLVDGLGLGKVFALGTSRGGILMMLGATVRPGLFQRSILNDIGPKIELDGLLKIKGHVGRDLGDMTWEKAVFALAVSQGRNFPRLDDAGWERYARRLWRDENGKPVSDYDPALALGLAGLTDATQLPESWDGFAQLAQTPVLALRGGLSDILSAEVVNEMAARHATVETYEIPDEAHAPLLEDPATLDRISRFLT
jgi:pimeloyl-ACP methyl ester carboxylesterase